MKIRIRTNLGSVEFPGMPWHAGDVREVDDSLGASMVAKGVAEEVAQPKTVAAVPDKPAISEAKKPEISGGQKK